MTDLSVSIFARTDIGMQRAGNEDSFLVADLTTGAIGVGSDVVTEHTGDGGSLLIVSDGMGGAAAGEVASDMAVTTVCDALISLPVEVEMPDRLEKATEIANERIWNHAQQNPELSGMGATLTAVVARASSAYVAQVGDSRAYLIRGGQIKQITKDQSFVQLLIESGMIKPEQAGSVPQNVIMQALGTQPTVKVVVTAVELCRDDCLLICSDGLSNKFTEGELGEMIQGSADLTAACGRLVELANERGGEDNITVILARFGGEGLGAAAEDVPIAASFREVNEDYFDEAIVSHYAPQNRPAPQEQEVITMAMPAITTTLTPIDVEASQQELATGVDDQPHIKPPPPKRVSYNTILIIGLVSLLLLAAAIYLAYLYYSERKEAEPGVIDGGVSATLYRHKGGA